METDARGEPGAGLGRRVSAPWDALIDEFVEGHLRARPHLAVAAGRHEFDGRLPDWSPSGLEADRDRLTAARRTAEEVPDAELEAADRLERDYLLAIADGELFWLDSPVGPRRNPYYYVDALSPQVYVGREYAPLHERMGAFVDYARAVPRAVAQIRENLRPPLPAAFVDLGVESFRGLADYYEEDARRAFADAGAPDLEEELGAATREAGRAMRELAAWLADVERAPAGEFTLGEAGMGEMLWATERVDVSPSRLHRLAEEEMDRNRVALRGACERLAPGQSVEACVRQLQEDKPDRPPVEIAREQVTRMRRFVDEHQLASVPEGGTTRVEASPPYLRWNAALIDIPGPHDGHLPAVYFISPPDPSWSDEERRAYQPSNLDLLFISLHEVWPGHYLHFLHANRSDSALARHFVGYGFAEGWAHYAEELCCEVGLNDGDPATEIGLRVSALLRTVRMLVALGLHAGEMSLEEAERLFRDRAYQDRATARQQAVRGLFDPAYLNYTMGKMMIRRLRADWDARNGGRGWREFHDRLLTLGGPPLPLAREALLGDPSGPLF